MLRSLAASVLYLAFSTAAFAQSWEDRIDSARTAAREIESWAATYGWDYNMIGTLIRTADVAVIRCSILAEMQGLGDISDHVEYYGPDPMEARKLPGGPVDADTFDFQQLLEYSMNLGIWAHQAEQFLAQTDDQRAEFWELSCNGQFGIPEGLLPDTWETAASFRLDGTALYVLGDIERGFFAEFADVVSRNEIDIVYLGSRGGSVRDAMDASALIRARGFDTDLHGDCESACPLIYFGGREPRVMFNTARFRLGFHQISADGEAIPLDSPIYDAVGSFVAEMGVDPDFVLAAMRRATPDDMYFPDYQSLCDANAVAWVYGSCSQPFPEESQR